MGKMRGYIDTGKKTEHRRRRIPIVSRRTSEDKLTDRYIERITPETIATKVLRILIERRRIKKGVAEARKKMAISLEGRRKVESRSEIY